jgi:hypothetical protein
MKILSLEFKILGVFNLFEDKIGQKYSKLSSTSRKTPAKTF